MDSINSNSIFDECTALATLTNLLITNTSTTNDYSMLYYTGELAFSGCPSLSKLTFSSDCGPFDFGINVSRCNLGTKALIKLMESLPENISTQGYNQLDISGNRGVSELTDADKQITIDKGWNVIT